MNKNLYLIRNVSRSHIMGKKEIASLFKIKHKWKHINEIELVVCDNDKRSLDSAAEIFTYNKPIITLNYLYPIPFNNTIYDKDIQYITNKPYANNNYSTKRDLFYDFLSKRNECSILYIGHNRFINKMLNNPLDQQLERGYPYLMELTFSDLCDN